MIKISRLEAENVKRIKAVKVEPTPSGLTIIGGNNGQGKTSVLDAITWALGGNKYKPSEPQRRESTIPPYLSVELSNGLVVERKGKNSSLKVIDPQGNSAGQALLDEFIAELALDLPKFMTMNNKDKANTLLQIIGVGDKLYELERQETELYSKRHAIGLIADQKEKFAKEMPRYSDAPEDLVSASALIKQQQEILARNGENQRKRERVRNIETDVRRQEDVVSTRKATIADLEQKLLEAKESLVKAESRLVELNSDLETARKSVKELEDESTAEIESSIEQIEEINRKVRANLDREKAIDDARGYRDEYRDLTTQIEMVRKQKFDLLAGAKLPLEGLSVEDGELTYNGDKWDGMSGSDQLIVATAIVRKLNPKCGFVLLDKLEQMDLNTLQSFGKWLEQEGLQAIATRVSTGDECSIIIDDGYVVGDLVAEPVAREDEPKWKAGEF
jgi:DNA repair ATPase RecN